MYSRRLASFFYIAMAALLCALLVQTTSAAPAPAPVPAPEPSSPSLGEVVGKNRNMACTSGTCYFKNATADSTAPSDNSTDSTSSVQSTSGASSLSGVRIAWPVVMVAGSSLLLTL